LFQRGNQLSAAIDASNPKSVSAAGSSRLYWGPTTFTNGGSFTSDGKYWFRHHWPRHIAPFRAPRPAATPSRVDALRALTAST
jgi:hypothetical protein